MKEDTRRDKSHNLKLAKGEHFIISGKRAEGEKGTEFSRTVCKLWQCLFNLPYCATVVHRTLMYHIVHFLRLRTETIIVAIKYISLTVTNQDV